MVPTPVPRRTLSAARAALTAVLLVLPCTTGRLHAELLTEAAETAPHTLFETAAALERGGEFQPARELYRDVCRERPGHGDAWHRLGIVEARLGDRQRTAIRPEPADLSTSDADLLPAEPVEAPLPFTAVPSRTPALLGPLTDRLSDADAGVRQRALAELAELAGQAQPAVEAIQPLLADAEPAVRAEAARAVWLIDARADVAVPALVELLDSGDPLVRLGSTLHLGTLGGAARRALPLLRNAMHERDGIDRVQAAEAVLRIAGRDGDAIALLVAAAHDADREVRFVAMYALGQVALERRAHFRQAAGALLTAAAQDPDPRIREAAALNLSLCRFARQSTAIQPAGGERVR